MNNRLDSVHVQETLERQALEALEAYVAGIEGGSTPEALSFIDSLPDPIRERFERLAESYRGMSHSATGTDAPETTASDDASLSGQIGAYRIVRELGRGGMGVVYLAEQTEPICRKVAIKVVRPGLATRRVLARFESERQTLAQLSHPSIAGILEAGSTRSGSPYFAMEYVHGVPVTDYCESEGLDTAARLELFVEITDAVQHAHHKGIIHRDLKPTNVLVTVVGGKPTPKIIDFGLAKALESGIEARGTLTEAGFPVGTPNYMSPEQVEAEPTGVDTRTDVYSLGALLYEMLTGSPPLDTGKPFDGAFWAYLASVRKRILDEQPVKPSVRVAMSSPESKNGERLRRPMLAKRLRGDLDQICLKALEKARERRYSSASEMASDVRRHLGHRPILASPPSFTGSFVRLCRRHRLAVSALAAIFLALTAGVTVSTIALVELKRKETALTDEIMSNVMLENVLDLIMTSVDPNDYGDRNILFRDVVIEASREVPTYFTARPRFEARLRTSFGSVLHSLGELSRADSELSHAVELLENLGDDEDLASALMNLSNIRHSRGRFDSSEELIRRALAIRVHAEGPRSLATADCLVLLSNVLRDSDEAREAKRYVRQALTIFRNADGADPDSVVAAAEHLAICLQDLGRFQKAERVFRRVLAHTVDARGADDPRALQVRSNFSAFLRRVGKVEEARLILEDILGKFPSAWGERHSATAGVMQNMAATLQVLGHPEEAESYLRRALEIREAVLGDEHRDTLASVNNLALAMLSLRRLEEAEQFARRSVELAKRSLGPTNTWTLTYESNLALILQEAKRFEESESICRSVLERRRSKFGPNSRWTMISEANLGAVLEELGRLNESERHFATVLEWFETHEPQAWELNIIRIGYGDVLTGLGRYAEAEALLQRALDSLRDKFDDDYPYIAEAEARLDDLYERWDPSTR